MGSIMFLAMCSGFDVVSGPMVGSWIQSELTGEPGTVGAVVPGRYAAYARILHPVESMSGERSSWEAVAERTGGTVHPQVQWHALVGVRDPDDLAESLGRFGQPRRGELPVDLFLEVTEVIAAVSDPKWCYFAFWTGWAWATGLLPLTRRPVGETALKGARTEKSSNEGIHGDLALPLLTVGTNDFRVLRGTLGSAKCIEGPQSPKAIGPHAPNILWPDDRSWCLVTDIDFDSTLVGGSKTLIQALASWHRLTVLGVVPDESLSMAADRVNTLS